MANGEGHTGGCPRSARNSQRGSPACYLEVQMPSCLAPSPLQGFSAPSLLPTKGSHSLAQEEFCPSVDGTLPSSVPKASPVVPTDLQGHCHCHPPMTPLLTQARHNWGEGSSEGPGTPQVAMDFLRSFSCKFSFI